jgi:hypothetical protein
MVLQIIDSVSLSRNRLSPRFIDKATMAKPIQGGEENLLQRISKIKKKKTRKNQNLPPKTMKRYQVVAGLHNDAPKRVTTHNAAVAETVRSRVFTRSRSMLRITTTTPPRELRHPQASPSLALRRAFARKNPHIALENLAASHLRVRYPNHDLGAAEAEAPPTPGSSTVRSTPST